MYTASLPYLAMSQPPPSEVHGLVEHLFRQEAGKLHAALGRLFGLEHLDLVEEVVQEALLQALRQWPYRGVPPHPAAWLAHVARNKALDALRRRGILRRVVEELERQAADKTAADPPALADEGTLADDQLAMVFACCHPALPADAQVALTLKAVGGFG